MSGSEGEAIAAVVVSYQSASTLDACLLRLRAARGVAQIRVVDNGSDDGTLEILQRHALADPRLRFVANPDNPGFSVACNQGAADSDAPWLAFVNPDLQVRPDSLERLRRHVQALGGEAVVGADLHGEDGQRDGAARRRDPDFAAMLRSPAAAARLDVAMDPAQPLQEVDAVSGALMMVPRALFTRIAGFAYVADRPGHDRRYATRPSASYAQRIAFVSEMACDIKDPYEIITWVTPEGGSGPNYQNL